MRNFSFAASAVFGLCLMMTYSTRVYSQSNPPSRHINVSRAIDTLVVPEPLGDRINSGSIEAGPKPTLDGKRLYYSRLGDPKNTGGEKDEDIWYNLFIDSTQSWSEAINMGAPLNNKGPNFVFEVGWTGDSLLLGNVYGKKGKMKAGLSRAFKTGNTWTTREIKLKNDYNISSKGTYDLSYNRKVLLISEEKDDSYGNRDLYVVLRKPKTKSPFAQSEAINLGPTINTAGDEASPFLSDDGWTLFFSSDGHKGYGMSDMFVCKRLDDTWLNWSNPENLGPKINTPFDDGQFVYAPHARYAYYSRGVATTRSDIYRIEKTRLFKVDITDKSYDEIGQTYVVEGVFDDDKSGINDQTYNNLEAVVNFLLHNKTMTAMVSTHSNKQKTRKEGFNLSDQRIAKIQEYLVSKGIEKERLSFQSYGQDVTTNTEDPEVLKQVAGQVEFSFVNYGR